MAVREARLNESMESWGRLGWVAWKIRGIFKKQPETLDSVMGDRWRVWRMQRAAEAEKQ